MELNEAIKGRRSVRKYTATPVEKHVLEQILEAGQWAPTACNVQGFRFIVIDSAEVLDQIVQGGAAAFLKNVKQAVLVVYDNQTDNLEYMDYIQSAAAAIQNMLLTAHALQVGTCWVNHLPRKNYLRTLLNIPACFDPIALITLGYYDYQPREVPRRKNVADIVSYNTYSFAADPKPKDKFRLLVRRLARKLYFHVSGMPIVRKIAGKYEKKFDN